MTDQNHPITPSKALEHKWASMFEQHSDMEVFTEVAQWGADQELEACCKWLPKLPPWSADDLRKHRRPKPPSLKEQALAALQEAAYMADDSPPQGICADQIDIIRRALEQLPDAL